MPDFSIIGKAIAMVDAAGKTTGAGKYTDDLASSASTPTVPNNWMESLLSSSDKTLPIPTVSFPSGTTNML